MAFKIIKVYKECFPACRLIGKRYTNDDRINGTFGAYWTEFHQNGWFNELEKLGVSKKVENSPLGLMTINATNHSNFSYWIGLLFPPEIQAPKGFSYLDLPESDVGMTWIYGSDTNGEIYGEAPHSASYNKLCEAGLGQLRKDAGGEDTLVFFERYNCPRISSVDEKGNVILDYGFYIK